jgi:hypothetical protein
MIENEVRLATVLARIEEQYLPDIEVVEEVIELDEEVDHLMTTRVFRQMYSSLL